MKTIIALISLFSHVAMAGTIVGTKHDFSDQGWAQNEICIVCHTPHNGNSSITDAPLWDRQITIKTFTPYTSTTMVQTLGGQPDGPTRLCLSCHDGSVAMDSFNGLVGTRFIGNRIGSDLNSGEGHWKHPLSIVYDVSLAAANTNLNNPATTITPLGRTIQQDLLFNNKVQCTSCHDVHNKQGLGKYLKIDKDNLCKVCHKNGM